MTASYSLIISCGILLSAAVGIWLISEEANEVREQKELLAARLSILVQSENRVISRRIRTRTSSQMSEADCDRVLSLLEAFVFKKEGRNYHELNKLLGANVSQSMAILERIRSSSSMNSLHKHQAVSRCLRRFSEADPEETMEFVFAANELIFGDSPLDVSYSLPMFTWLKRSPELVLKWVDERESQLPQKVVSECWRAIVPAIAPSDPKLAMELFKKLEPGTDNQLSAASCAAYQLETTEQFREFYQAWSSDEQLSDKTHRAWVSSFARTLLRRPLVDRFALVESLDFQELESRELAKALLKQQQSDSPKEWLGWLAEKMGYTEPYLSKYLDNWAMNDFKAYGNWLNSEPEGELRELGIERYVNALAPHEPQAAEDWAKSLKNAEKRNELLDRLAR